MNNASNSQLPPGMLMKCIQNEEEKIDYYTQLQTMTTNQENIDIISGIICGEKEHLDVFINLFRELFLTYPELNGVYYKEIASFTDGIQKSIKIELNSFDLYNSIYLYEQDLEIRNIFLHVMLEENNHAAKFNYILEKLIGHL